jgi:membrane protein YqaA with SNARE-associated domain
MNGVERLTDSRSGIGPVVAVIGAALLALSVFFPWYGVTITASGATYAQQAFQIAAAKYGNATLQAEANAIGSSFSRVAGHQIATLSAHQMLKNISVILLLLAALAFLGALIWLTGASGSLEVSGGQVAAVGMVATVLVLYRMVDRPGTYLNVYSLSLGWGAWLALLSSLGIVVGGLIGWANDQPPQRQTLASSPLSSTRTEQPRNVQEVGWTTCRVCQEFFPEYSAAGGERVCPSCVARGLSANSH